MDAATRQRLDYAAAQTPRYLFRAWNNVHAGRISGGYPGLNTTRAITPLAFHKRARAKPTKYFYEMETSNFSTMILAHAQKGKPAFLTHLSSWSASLAFVLDYALTLGTSAHISIIDTTQLSDQNAVWHLPALTFLSPDLSRFDHEYVTYGVLKGPGYKAVPLSKLLTLCIPRESRWQTAGDWAPTHPITAPEVATARSIGALFGPTFALPVAVAILTLRKRDKAFFRDGVPSIELVMQGLAQLELPREHCGRASLVQNVASHGTWADAEQMYRLLKALIEWHYGIVGQQLLVDDARRRSSRQRDHGSR